MKKWICGMLTLLLLMVFSGCTPDDRPVLKVFNWGEYIDESVLDDFESETGVRVQYETYETNESMYTKIKSGGAANSYDIVIPSDYMISRMVREGMLAELDYSNIPNYELLMEQFVTTPYNNFDPQNKYTVPYVWGTVGIVYDKTRVTKPVDSWNILWDEDFKGEILMKDDQRDSIGIALKSLGFSVNSTNDDELALAKEKLINQKDLVLAYVTDEGRDKMISNEAMLAVMYSGDASYVMSENENLEYALPKEGSNVWLDSMCVLRTSQNKALAEQFINFMCRTDIAQKNIDYIEYNTPQKEVAENYTDEQKESILYSPDPEYISKNCEIYLDLGNYTEKYAKIWTEVTAN